MNGRRTGSVRLLGLGWCGVIGIGLLVATSAASASQALPVRYEISYHTTADIKRLEQQEAGESARFIVSVTAGKVGAGGRLTTRVRLDSIIDTRMSAFKLDSSMVAPEIRAAASQRSGVTLTEQIGPSDSRLLEAEPLLHPLIGPLRAVITLVQLPFGDHLPGQRWDESVAGGWKGLFGSIFDGFAELGELVPIVYHWDWTNLATLEFSASGSQDVVRRDALLAEVQRTTTQLKLDGKFEIDSAKTISAAEVGVRVSHGKGSMVTSVGFQIRRLGQ